MKGVVRDERAEEVGKLNNICTITTVEKDDSHLQFTCGDWDYLHEERRTNMVGIVNIEGNCYANALVQMLYHIMELRMATILLPGKNIAARKLS